MGRRVNGQGETERIRGAVQAREDDDQEGYEEKGRRAYSESHGDGCDGD